VSCTRACRALFVALSTAFVLTSGCSPVPDFGTITPADAYEIGVDAAEREDYLLAVEAFKRALTDSPLSEFADDALLGLADAHRAIGDFAAAEEEYKRLLSDYPRSELVPVAEYDLGLTYYEQSLPAALDQTMTKQAIEQFRRFIAEYPGSELVPEAEARIAELRSRLAEKAYENARLYLTLGDAASARVYFESVVDEYPDTVWAPRALLEEARTYVGEGAIAAAADTYARLTELYPDSDEAAAARAEAEGLAP